MADKRPDADAVVIERFWHNYLSILGKTLIHKAAIPWYLKHVEAYITDHSGQRLAAHLPAQIDDYLNAKGRLPASLGVLHRQITGAQMWIRISGSEHHQR